MDDLLDLAMRTFLTGTGGVADRADLVEILGFAIGRVDQYGVGWFPPPGCEREQIVIAQGALRLGLPTPITRSVERLEVPLGVYFAATRVVGGVNMRLIVDEMPCDRADDSRRIPQWGQLKSWYNVSVDMVEQRCVAPCWRLDVRFVGMAPDA